MYRRRPIIGLSVLICLSFAATARSQYEYNQKPINYSNAAVSDPVAQLQKRILAGSVELRPRGDQGYLRSVLAELGILESSQTLVFSKTSFQREGIHPSTPRALYFDDDTYIGYVQGGDVLEVATTDPAIGTVFYTLDQFARGKPRFVRQTENCLQCHASTMTHDVPGLMIRSVYPDPRGQPILSEGTKVTTHESPFSERYGGWYISGRHGAFDVQKHMGNLVGKSRDDAEPVDPKAGTNVTDLSKFFDTSAYLTPHSDIVAMTVLAHQAEAHNLMTKANYACKFALRDARIMNEALGQPLDEMSDSTHRRINSSAETLLRYLLFCDEAPLAAPIEGTSTFARDFTARGPRDSRGRSLRDFDLTRRTFKYPLSYLIYSRGFDGLPEQTRSRLYARLFEVLTGKDQDKAFAHLSADDRRAILEILLETKKDLPACFQATRP
ncbi:hypothetical protein IPV69_05580 [Humisphaera borealis]|uniref:Cytochrome c domain-containing protein n=2 Tax=Humisphaera borealis TaxID=2807512 RepID=A0A7M2X3L1_9BACT|nr:hypothetical protein IPV69_05580 [Humisphaera borealis]